MITGNLKEKTEKEYRNLSLDSSSSLKIFSQDRRKYCKIFIEGLTEEVEEDTKASVMGKLVETKLLEADKFDERFFMSSCECAPTSLMLVFVEELYRLTKEATDEGGNVNKSFEEISKEAYTFSGYKISYERVISNFAGKEPEIYFNEIKQVRSKGLTVVTMQDVSDAERIVEELKTNFVTKDIINLVSNNRWDVRNQFQIEGYEVDGHKFKSMIDLLITDHKEKTISVFDLKCTFSVEDFYEFYFLKRRSYIQGYLYYKAALTLMLKEEFFGYLVLPPQFIVCDSINYYNPLIYRMSYADLDDAYKGFEYKGRQYPGVQSLIEDLSWALQKNIWSISRENYLLNGIVNIKK
jgi:hypothetical protein